MIKFARKHNAIIPVYCVVGSLIIYVVPLWFVDLFCYVIRKGVEDAGAVLIDTGETFLSRISVVMAIGLTLIIVPWLHQLIQAAKPDKHRELYYVCQYACMMANLGQSYILIASSLIRNTTWCVAIMQNQMSGMCASIVWEIAILVLMYEGSVRNLQEIRADQERH